MTIESCNKMEEVFKLNIAKKLRIFEEKVFGEVGPNTCNIRVKAKLKDSVARKIFAKKWVNLNMIPKDGRIAQLDHKLMSGNGLEL